MLLGEGEGGADISLKKCLYNDASEELASEYYAFKNTPQKEEDKRLVTTQRHVDIHSWIKLHR